MPTEKRIAKFTRVAAQRQQGLTVVLEDIHDPHNAAAVFRTCDAFGVQDVHIIFDQEKPFNPKRIGKISSSSANKWLDFHIHESTEACLGLLRESGHTIVTTGFSDQSIPIVDADLGHDTIALVFGNEHRGISDTARRLCDMEITIPMRGVVQSLNLSVSAAICLYEVTRQRGGDTRYLYSEQDQKTILERFLK